MTKTRTRSAGALLAGLALTCATALASSAEDGCAPAGATVPRLALHPRPGEMLSRLLFSGGSDLAFGTAYLVLEGPTGSSLPAGPCTSGIVGRVAGPVQLDHGGHAVWDLPAWVIGMGDALRVVAWAPGAAPSEGRRSNAVRQALKGQWGTEKTGQGDVLVTEFLKDPTTVSDTTGEWIELHNPTGQPIDVEGWALTDFGSDFALLDNSGLGIVIQPGGYLVLGKSIDPVLNGDVPVDIVYTGFTLSNGADEIVLSKPNGTVIDAVAYDDGVTFPDDAGRSISLNPDHFDAAENDLGANWCHSTTPISSNNPDTGTPRKANDACL